MTQSVKNKKSNRDIKSEAAKLIKAVNVKGESRAETQRLTAGVQRALELHLRQHNAKARELDKKAKKLKHFSQQDAEPAPEAKNVSNDRQPRLPWFLLALSWLIFIGYLVWTLT